MQTLDISDWIKRDDRHQELLQETQETLKAKAAEIDFPMDSEGQHTLSMTVACAFCGEPAGAPCVPSLIFPQYPHTLRIQDALVAKGHSREVVLKLYEF